MSMKVAWLFYHLRWICRRIQLCKWIENERLTNIKATDSRQISREQNDACYVSKIAENTGSLNRSGSPAYK